jgi:hypothetical protein
MLQSPLKRDASGQARPPLRGLFKGKARFEIELIRETVHGPCRGHARLARRVASEVVYGFQGGTKAVVGGCARQGHSRTHGRPLVIVRTGFLQLGQATWPEP